MYIFLSVRIETTISCLIFGLPLWIRILHETRKKSKSECTNTYPVYLQFMFGMENMAKQFLSSPEGQKMIMDFISSPEGINTIKKMVGTPEGKTAIGTLVKTALPALGVGNEEMGMITGIVDKFL